jgi:preprotein translocase subunit SecA
MKALLRDIKLAAENYRTLSDEELTWKIEEVKRRAQGGKLDQVLPEWFALTQQVSSRTLGLCHFDTQLLAGIHLHNGKIVEMKTGEGKTLASTLPVALNALSGKGVHVVTVNDYLAERDQKWMGKVYKGLGLSVGLVKSNSTFQEKKNSYEADITYVTNSELVFDYLRDTSAYYFPEIVQRPFSYCIVDEIDSILLDEARTPLIISTAKGALNQKKLYLANVIAKTLQKDLDFQIDEKRRDINLTEVGYQKTKDRIGITSLYDPKDPWILEILNALKAQYLFKQNKDYVIVNQKVAIVDEFSGRIMEDRRWSLGIHEAIEVKEKIRLGQETKTKTSMTYQNFFTLYPKLAGMTGTGKTAEKEFQDIYNLDVVAVPTSKPMVRQDFSDLVYQTELFKWKAVLQQSKDCYTKGQPILIGTSTLEKSEFLSDLFKASNIPHQLLNAKPENVTRESEIVAQAGERYAVTIATNMAGRGTDIILGGNPNFKVKQILEQLFLSLEDDNSSSLKIFSQNPEKYFPLIEVVKQESPSQETLEQDLRNLPYSLETTFSALKTLYSTLYNEVLKNWEEENKLVKELGGLFVIGTERHENRRIDNQLRGRAGRQGDPGYSRFYVSLEDDLIKIFGGERISGWMSSLVQDKEMPLESDFLSQSLENAQIKVEDYNYEIRKNVFQYDDILNNQRKLIFGMRQEILEKNSYPELFFTSAESKFAFYKETTTQEQNSKTKKACWAKKRRRTEKQDDERILQTKLQESQDFDIYSRRRSEDAQELWISQDFRLAERSNYQLGFSTSHQKRFFLEEIDKQWSSHLERMDYIRETISWRSYGQQNPLVEYNQEASQSFCWMIQEIRNSMVYYFSANRLLR